MKRKLALGIALVSLAVYAAPVLAAQADLTAEEALAAIFAPAPESDLAAAPQPQEASTIAAKSTCSVTCWNNSVLTCSGTSCGVTPSNCSTGQRGSCSGSTSGTKTCPVCPGCSTTAVCANGSKVSCTGHNSCFSIDKCYSSCDGTLHWCGGHGTCPV